MAAAGPSSEAEPASGLRARLARRADSEHEQALIRIVFAVVITLYVVLLPPDGRTAAWLALAVGLASLALSIGLFGHIVLWPAVNIPRRFCGLVIDTVGLNAMMLIGGTAAAPFYPALLWVILGHGFRFGRRQLAAAAAISCLLFLGVVAMSESWREVPALDVALLLALVLLPLYFAALLSRLHAAIARAEEASTAKSRFLATMSHEFRTPLNAVIGLGELLEGTRLDRDQHDMVMTIRDAANSLLALVNDLLDLARIEAQRFAVDDEPFDLFARIAAVRALLAHEAAQRSLQLVVHIDPMTPRRLIGGGRVLHQILVNLTANALRFTDAGTVTIRIRPLDPGGPRCRLQLEVEDSGVGIPSELQEQIFESFEQGDRRTDRHQGGTGLGLSIVRQLAELMGGRVAVRSEPGRGACFTVELVFARDLEAPSTPLAGRVVVLGAPDRADPVARRLGSLGVEALSATVDPSLGRLLAPPIGRAALLLVSALGPADEAAIAELLAWRGGHELVDIVTLGAIEPPTSLPLLAALPTSASDELLRVCLGAALVEPDAAGRRQTRVAPAPMARRPVRVLVAEDNRTNRQLVGRILGRAGHTPTLVDSGEAAIEALEAGGYDVVLMDINMPGMSGLETLKLLRFAHRPEELPPVLVLSADASEATRRDCLAAGFSGYLTKPVDTVLLLQRIDDVLAGRELGPEAAAAEPERAPVAASVARDELRPAIDEARLASLAALDDGDGFLASLIDDFLADVATVADRLEEAALAGRIGELRDAAHALRSSAAHIGAVGLFELCLSWRDLDDATLERRAEIEVAALRRELARLRLALLGARDRVTQHRPAAGLPV